ncbi:MAG: TonB family protein [Gemmatimonadota bacterium]
MPTFALAEPQSSFVAALPSTLVHAALIWAAIWASQATVAAVSGDPIQVSIAWPVQTTTHPVVSTPTPALPAAPIVSVPVLPPIPTTEPSPVLPGTPRIDPTTLTPDTPPGVPFVPGGDPGSAAAIFREAEVDELPALLAAGRLRYPAVLAESGIAGSVTLAFVIDVEGSVEAGAFEVLAATHQGFVAAAVEAVVTSRFRPARKGGVAVRVRVRQTVTFRR